LSKWCKIIALSAEKERNLSRFSEYVQKLCLTKMINNRLEIAIE
jgi:hypothetical protein